MARIKRLLIVLTIFLSGTVLIPYFSLPDDAFSWQNFTNGYGYDHNDGSTNSRP